MPISQRPVWATAVGLAVALPLAAWGRAPQQPVVRYPTVGAGQPQYVFTRQDTVVAAMPGGETQTQVIGRAAYLSLRWAASDSGTRIDAAIDSVIPDDPGSRFSPSMDSTLGVRWSAWREPDGHLVRVEGGPASSIADEVRDQLRFLFPTLPPGGATPGLAWRDSTEGPALVSAFEARESARSTSVATGATGKGLTITVVRQRTATGTGRQYAQPITVGAAGTDSLAYTMAEDGVVVEVTARRHTQLELDLPAVGQHVSAEVRTTLGMRLLP